MKKTRRTKRHYPCPPPPERSSRLYVRIAREKIALFRFLLEAHDNLGIFTVVSKFTGILMLRYTPHQEREMRAFLKGIGDDMDIEVLLEAPEPRVPSLEKL
ncbi:DUF4911 domain-containing protein [Salidesulfovibrio onnuriiensis]|uniref:DUF4911 domain-containing protein n=1 Tax=Salidesulfovibrio onnuriiensis TaxID=2583823 RepID=UPI0011CBD2FB|nr:DUF4911 domain-containing protein [Salidesulfovibrio onnuriiensis]